MNICAKTPLAFVFLLLVSGIVFSQTETENTDAGEPVLASGQLANAFSSWGSASLEGDWSIVQTEEGSFLELADNFSAKSGPDVKIFLSPLAANEVNKKNAADGGLFLKLLETFEGSARIKIPEGTDLSNYQSLVFHCEKYSKLWGTSPL